MSDRFGVGEGFHVCFAFYRARDAEHIETRIKNETILCSSFLLVHEAPGGALAMSLRLSRQTRGSTFGFGLTVKYKGGAKRELKPVPLHMLCVKRLPLTIHAIH